jgi:MFS family permease
MARDDRGLMLKCPKCKTKISPGYSICLSCGFKFSSDTKDVKKPVYEGGVEYVSDNKVEEKRGYFSQFGYPGSIGILLLASFIIAFLIVSGFGLPFNLIFGTILVLGIISGLGGLYSVKRDQWIHSRQIEEKDKVKSKKLKDVFSISAIISIGAGLIGIIIYYVLVPSDPFTNFKSFYVTPFLLVGTASGIYGIYKGSIPVIDLIGTLIGGIWFFISIMPAIAYLAGLFGLIMHGAP